MTNSHLNSFLRLLMVALLATHRTVTSSSSSGDDITGTCRVCARATPSLSYKFCVSSLRSVPASRHVDLRGLALISIELAIVNASETISTVEGMINQGSYDQDPVAMSCLKECLGGYEDATDALLRGVGDFTAGKYTLVGESVSGVMDMCKKCEGGFEKGGKICPLKEENYDLFQLCNIALCIIVGNLSSVPGESVV
ncbi:hypothetical protein MLD38_036489 [Melastoma candidum]|uniref:Uncharacterized protein n=1 Tax=Melastoma candidum TaxID=119954 RepID=A0ACB9LJV1_9MYRT|nr:hypothetical protein MLD38_036489 [Melastoma candidum]